MRDLLIIEPKAGLVKLFHKANFFVVLISGDNLSIEHIQDTSCVTKFLIHEIQYNRNTKLVKLTIRTVFAYFLKALISSGDNSRYKK